MTNEGVSNLPEEIKEAVGREPIVIGPESIGSHFRNTSEIDDIKALLAKRQQRGSIISAGLVGPRLGGKFSFDPRELYEVIRSFDPSSLDRNTSDYDEILREGLDTYEGVEHRDLDEQLNVLHRIFRDPEMDRDEEDISWASRREVPGRLFQPLTELAEYLDQQRLYNANLSDIRFEGLSQIAKRGTLWETFSIPLIYRADLARDEYPSRESRIHPHPAVLYPHINIAVITDAREDDVWRKIGENSGTGIQEHIVSAFSTPKEHHVQQIRNEILQTYRPLEIRD